MAPDQRRPKPPLPAAVVTAGRRSRASRPGALTAPPLPSRDASWGLLRRLEHGEIDEGGYRSAVVDGALRHLGGLSAHERAFVRAALEAALDEHEAAGALLWRVVRASGRA